jgi:hypothetical protein
LLKTHDHRDRILFFYSTYVQLGDGKNYLLGG